MLLFVSDINRQITFTSNERAGLTYINNLRVFLEHMQKHRGMMNALLEGDPSFQELILVEEQELDRAVQTIDSVNSLNGRLLKAEPQWESIKTKWSQLKQTTFLLTPKESFDTHTSLVADSLALIGTIRGTSGLQIDLGTDSYILMDTVTNKLPVMLETIGRARGLGSGMAAKASVSPEERTQLIMLSGMIQSGLDELTRGADSFEETSLRQLVQPYHSQYMYAAAHFLSTMSKELIVADQVTIKSADYFAGATVALNSGYKLYDVESPALDVLLKHRIDRLTMKKWITVSFASVIFLIISYMFLAFYVSVTKMVHTLKRASQRIVDGDLSVRVELATKDELSEVGSVFNSMIQTFGLMMREREQHEKQIEKLAYYDSLTGLPNRILFEERFQISLSNAKRERLMVAVMFLDLDRFKNINDTLGHDAGDLLLQTTASRLKSCVRSGDTVSRLGGDEFLLVIAGIKKIEEAMKVADKIIHQLNIPVPIHEHELVVSGSIGISLYPFNGDDAETLIKHADIAMYHAKSQGRNKYQLFDQELNSRAQSRMHMEISLRQGLDRNEFVVYYQPRYDIATNSIIGMEALVRWMHPQLGLVPPSEFIPVAEEIGLIVPLGEWVLHTACMQNKCWQTEELSPVLISVNISMTQFQRDDFVDMVKQVLVDTGLQPEWLELELTESIVMKHVPMTIVKLNELKELGIHISIDDFGTGFSSLNYLKYLPIDKLKIDRSFIKDVPDAPKDTAITKTIIALGRRLSVKVVAEGVETEEQLQFLANRKCAEVQGFLYSGPLPASEARMLLSRQAAFFSLEINSL
jgi:diguanylate cyclase (GGDEF)-like protein